MKSPSLHRPNGFTLIELLVVIAIIAVLAGGGFAAGNAAIQKARKTTALASATAIESAVNNFYTEYGSMPKTGTADTTVDTAQDTELLRVLLGIEPTGGDPLNPRKIKFLSVKEGKKKGTKGTNGLIYSGSGGDVQGLYDPWGGGYKVTLDLDYDERLTVSPAGGGGASLNARRVAVWSNGADGVNGGGKSSDDVKTWGQ